MDEDEQLEGAALYLTLLTSLAIGIGLFFLLPTAVGRWSEVLFGWNAWWGNLLEGIVRLVLLIAYIALIGLLPDVKRLYMYHGAEHKTIHAFEADAPLTPESVARFPREHPRCGTAFLLTLVVLSLVLFSLLGPLPLWPRLLSRVLLDAWQAIEDPAVRGAVPRRHSRVGAAQPGPTALDHTRTHARHAGSSHHSL